MFVLVFKEGLGRSSRVESIKKIKEKELGVDLYED